MNGMPRATRQLLSGSGKSYVRLWTRSPRIRKRGHAIAAIFDGMSFPGYPFSLVYRVRDSEIQVIAVAHGRRHPGYWRSRLRDAL
jgi:toxin ParE1/3/4